MNLKKIAPMLAIFPTLAMAYDGGTTLYGRISGTFSNDKTFSPAGSVQNVNDKTSRLGFRGEENLGNGIKALWQVESRIHVDGSGTDTLGSRDTFVGLQRDDLGKIRLGYLSNYANLDMELSDIALITGASAIGSTIDRADGRIKNAIRYDSPVWAGFSFTTIWGADETRSSSTTTGTVNNQIINLGLSYKNGGFISKFNYLTKGDAQQLSELNQQKASAASSANNASSLYNWWRLETGIINDSYTLIGGFQRINGYLGVNTSGQFGTDTDGVVYNITALNARLSQQGKTFTSSAAAEDVTAREAFITYGYNIGRFMPYFQLAKGYDLDIGSTSIDKTGYKQYVIGTVYNLSKTTQMALAYGYVNWGGSGVMNQSSLSLGLAKWF